MTRHEHARDSAPEWLRALAEARNRVTGGDHPHDVGGVGPASPGPALWDPLPASAGQDLAAWWAWVDSLPADGQDHCPLLPPRAAALPYETARDYCRFMRQIAIETQVDPDDWWRESYVPLTGDQDAAFIVDVGDPELPVYWWWLEGGLEPPEPIGHGVRSLADQMTALLDAGCYRYVAAEQRFARTRAPLPDEFTDAHPLIRWAGLPQE